MASVEPEDKPIYGSIDLEGGGIVPLLRYVSFNIRPWLEQASEEDVSRLFHAEYASQTNQEVMDWCLSRASGLKQRLQETTHRAGGHVIQRPMVDMPATADWVATNRMGWFFVPEMCRDWGIDLLVVMARQGTPARRNPDTST